MAVDWVATWAVLGPAVVGLGTWLKTRKPNQAAIETAVAAARAEAVNADSTSAAVNLLRAEVTRLSARVQALEGREGRLIRHVYRLEGLMTAAGITPPPFDIDGAQEKSGGSD